ncbi:hypothetical protein [Streptomyces sp. NPDC096339]|uniref:hypothetical protein n=1 Tax=Streptomyces sp. NPDC096339 TaxID=3366086 RepID=UPI0038284210
MGGNGNGTGTGIRATGARRKVVGLPWGAAVTAAAVAVAMSLALGGRDFLWLALFQSPIALPLLTRWAPKAFPVACFVVGAPMLLLGLPLALYGIPAFLAAPLLLIFAAFADRLDRQTGATCRAAY